MLQHKNAIVYGTGGSLGTVIAKAFAAAGARVFLTGRNFESLQKTAEEIGVSGGLAIAAVVDAMDEASVGQHISGIAEEFGGVDISFNLIGLEVVQNTPLVEMSLEDFVRPVNIAMRAHFITATAAARVMRQQRSGVILTLTATPGGIGYSNTAGFAPACAAIESLSRNLGAELGPYGIRTVNIRSGGSPDSRVFREAIAAEPELMKKVIGDMENDTMLKRLPVMADIANTAVFAASDWAAGINGVTIDVTCGTTAALNHKTSPAGPSREAGVS